jgi:hypothetical protein
MGWFAVFNEVGAVVMTINIVAIQPLVALIAGILILLIPRILNFVVAIYLILIGVLGLWHHLVHWSIKLPGLAVRNLAARNDGNGPTLILDERSDDPRVCAGGSMSRIQRIPCHGWRRLPFRPIDGIIGVQLTDIRRNAIPQECSAPRSTSWRGRKMLQFPDINHRGSSMSYLKDETDRIQSISKWTEGTDLRRVAHIQRDPNVYSSRRMDEIWGAKAYFFENHDPAVHRRVVAEPLADVGQRNIARSRQPISQQLSFVRSQKPRRQRP